jgi:hypothetical protein
MVVEDVTVDLTDQWMWGGIKKCAANERFMVIQREESHYFGGFT